MCVLPPASHAALSPPWNASESMRTSSHLWRAARDVLLGEAADRGILNLPELDLLHHRHVAINALHRGWPTRSATRWARHRCGGRLAPVSAHGVPGTTSDRRREKGRLRHATRRRASCGTPPDPAASHRM